MSEKRSFSGWLLPSLITILTIVAGFYVFSDTFSSIRFLFVFLFLLFCPGLAYVRLLCIEDKFVILILAVALSLALDTIVSLVFLYLDRWTSQWIFGILVFVTLCGVTLQFWKLIPKSVHHDLDSSSKPVRDSE